MDEQIVFFREEDTQFRFMETALNGKPSSAALKALHYTTISVAEHVLMLILSLSRNLMFAQAWGDFCVVLRTP